MKKNFLNLVLSLLLVLLFSEVSVYATTETTETSVTVTTPEQLTAALSNSQINTIHVESTIGSNSTYTRYDVERNNVTIQGTGTVNSKIYGTFVVKADGVTIDGLTIQNKGDLVNQSTWNRGAIYLYANSGTIINNTIQNGLGDSSGLSNGIQVMRPSTTVNEDSNAYIIEGNTLIGHDQSVTGWTSSGIVVTENLSSGTAGGSYYGILVDDYDIATKNTFINNKIDYVHQNWENYSTKGTTVYAFVNTKDRLSAELNSARDGATILVGPGTFDGPVSITKDNLTLKAIELGTTTLAGVVTITSDNVTLQNLSIEVDSGPFVLELRDINNVNITNNIIQNLGEGYGSIVTSTGPARVTGEISNNTLKGALVLGSEGQLSILNKLSILNNKISTNTQSGEAIALYPATATSEFIVKDNEFSLLENKGAIKVQPLVPATKPEGIQVNDKTSDLDIILSLMEDNSIGLDLIKLTWNDDSIKVVDFFDNSILLKQSLVVQGSSITLPAAPTKTGYTFAGWFGDAALNNQFDFTTTITNNTTLYAKWNLVIVETPSIVTQPFVPTPPVIETDDKELGVVVEGLDAAVELTAIEIAQGAKVKLTIEAIDEDTIDKEELEVINNFIQENLKLDNVKSLFLDISLFKVIGLTETSLSSTNNKITISFVLPMDFRNSEFVILRNHENKIEILPHTYNQQTHLVTFETDRFSTYAVIADAETADESEEVTPRTSDRNNLLGYWLLIVGLFLLKKSHKALNLS